MMSLWLGNCKVSVGLDISSGRRFDTMLPTSIDEYVDRMCTDKTSKEGLFEIRDHMGTTNDHAFDANQLVRLM